MAEPVQLYICFADEDEDARSKLEKQLEIITLAGKIQIWHRDEIKAGNSQDQDIATHLDRAQIILMLVSADLFKNYNSAEVQRAFQLHKEQKVHLIPIIVKHCMWEEDTFLGSLEPLPKGGEPAGLNDSAWYGVAKEINQIARQMQSEQAIKEPAPSTKPSKPRAKSRKSARSKPQQLSGAVLTINAPITKRPPRSTSLPVPLQPALPDHTLPSVEEPQPRTTEARTTTPTFGQDYDQIREDMLKIVFSILIWEPSHSTHALIASERQAIHQALLDQHHRSTLGSMLPIPEGASLQDCEITRANTSDMTFVIVEPEIPSMLEWQTFYRITDEKFLNKTHCYYPDDTKVSGQLDKDLHTLKKLDYYQETQITSCHIRTEVLDWVRIKRTFMYRSGQSSGRGR